MTYAFKKIYVATVALMIAAVSQSQAFAAYAPANERLGDFSSSVCCEPECCQPACGTWSFGASLLCWRGFEGGVICDCLPEEITDVLDAEGHTTSEIRGRNDEFRFDWNAGFRLGAGYQFACSKWELGAYWTHFSEKGHGKNSRENFAHLNINFDEVDLLAGYKCELCPCMALTPFIGLRGVRINQKLHSAINTIIFSEEEISFVTSRRHDKEDFWGVGPVLGVEAEWALGCGFSIYGILDSSVLYGRFDNSFDNFEENIDLTTNCDSGERRTAALLAGDAGLGVRWAKTFCNDLVLTLDLGWEHHHYFDYNHLGSGGDLSLDGVSLSAGLSF